MNVTVGPTAELLFAAEDAVSISTDPSTVKSWAEASEQLATAGKFWLATGRPDGSPHVVPILSVWHEGALFVSIRPASRKARNLSEQAHCVITTSVDIGEVVIEGTATQVLDDADLIHTTKALAAKYQWVQAVRDGRVFQDDLPGSPEYVIYKISPTKAFGYGPDGLTATRWRF